MKIISKSLAILMVLVIVCSIGVVSFADSYSSDPNGSLVNYVYSTGLPLKLEYGAFATNTTSSASMGHMFVDNAFDVDAVNTSALGGVNSMILDSTNLGSSIVPEYNSQPYSPILRGISNWDKTNKRLSSFVESFSYSWLLYINGNTDNKIFTSMKDFGFMYDPILSSDNGVVYFVSDEIEQTISYSVVSMVSTVPGVSPAIDSASVVFEVSFEYLGFNDLTGFVEWIEYDLPEVFDGDEYSSSVSFADDDSQNDFLMEYTYSYDLGSVLSDLSKEYRYDSNLSIDGLYLRNFRLNMIVDYDSSVQNGYNGNFLNVPEYEPYYPKSIADSYFLFSSYDKCICTGVSSTYSYGTVDNNENGLSYYDDVVGYYNSSSGDVVDTSIIDWLLDVVEAFFSFEFFYGFTISDIFYIVFGISLVLVILKIFAGG